MNARVLALLLRPSPGERTVVALPVIAFGVVTALVLIVIGGAQVFWTWTDPEAALYHALAAIALVLLIVPLFTLGAAAARLSARRRDERLSTLRLLGVSPAGVIAATVIESTCLALAGAAVGVLGYLAAVPLVALIPFRGEALGMPAVMLSGIHVAGVVLGVVALAAVSATIGLRRVVISPLGVRMRSDVPRVHWIRGLVAVGVIAAAIAMIQLFPRVADLAVTIVVVAALFGAVLAVLNLVGPWVLKLQARGRLRRAQRPEQLLSARHVLESPKAAWQQVSGVAMTSFVAVFAGTAVAVMDGMGGADPAGLLLANDIRTGVIITLVASFLMVAVSVGVNQASGILDQRDLHRSLHHLGMPERTVDVARRQSTMSPLLMTSIGSAVCAAAMMLPLIGVSLIVAPLSLLTIAAVIAAGIGLVWVGVRVTSPLLGRAFQPA